jgi:hypothetical protein
MKSIALFSVLLLCPAAWADTVYFQKGKILSDVRVIEASQGLSGPVLLLEPTAPSRPGRPMRGWYPGAVHVDFGTPPPASTAPLAAAHRPMVGLVQSAFDAITLVLDDGRLLRLAGLQNPDAFSDPQPLAQRVSSGTMVWVEFPERRIDGENRLVGYVFVVPSGKFLNAELLLEGVARRDAQAPDRADYAARLREAEDRARKLNRGLWGRKPTAQAVRGNRRPPAVNSLRAVPVLSDSSPLLAPADMRIDDLPPVPPSRSPKVVIVEPPPSP